MEVDMEGDEELARALMLVVHAGYDVMLPGKVEELRAMAGVADRRRVERYTERDWSRAN